MTLIADAAARTILDSRGNLTLEAEVLTESGGFGRAGAPSGASTGKHEVKAWPEGGAAAALKAARKAVIPALVGLDAADQPGVDGALATLDGTPDFRTIGGNVATAFSLASARAAADALGVPLYRHLGGAFPSLAVRPFGNVLGGGAHAIGGTSIQEFMAVGLGPTIRDSVLANAQVHKRVGAILKEKLPGQAIGKGDEGAWVAPVEDEEALTVVARACEEVSGEVRWGVKAGLDVAATELWTGKAYKYRTKQRSPKEQLDFMAKLADTHGLFSIEDPFHEEAFDAFAELTERVGDHCLVIADDLTVTNPARLAQAIEAQAGNAILIKVNQIGTLTRTAETIRMAHDAGWKCVVSHRSGETTDDSIAHLAVAMGCLGLKTGAVGGERIAKLNELMRIEGWVRGEADEPSAEPAARSTRKERRGR
ncbi:MAG TPA: enolase C-terminal domain-like protein [Candidatus Thermoplasmatota archaeon]|jgi:enolase|nr:enolase C-terminal domain-like protein [Candidatus Thermoplasmatota archaeon]